MSTAEFDMQRSMCGDDVSGATVNVTFAVDDAILTAWGSLEVVFDAPCDDEFRGDVENMRTEVCGCVFVMVGDFATVIDFSGEICIFRLYSISLEFDADCDKRCLTSSRRVWSLQ